MTRPGKCGYEFVVTGWVYHDSLRFLRLHFLRVIVDDAAVFSSCSGMKHFACTSFSLCLLAMSGCGGNSQEPQVPAEEPPSQTPQGLDAPSSESEPLADTAESPAPAQPAQTGVPDTCAPGRDDCVPDPAFVKRLCNDVHQETALYMFRSGTPWQRVYLKGRVEAINASGGATVQGFLEFDEEVLVMRLRKASADGIQIGDSTGSYDVLRWNGSCASLDGGELTSAPPPKVKSSRVEWRYLGENVRTALRRDEKLAEGVQARQKECKGATMGAVSKKCETLDNKLVDQIVKYVRSTSDLPQPDEKY
jgi:hypothetical protein